MRPTIHPYSLDSYKNDTGSSLSLRALVVGGMDALVPHAHLDESSRTIAASSEYETVMTQNKSIYDLLHETPTNWDLIQHRATIDKASFPKDFIALMFMLGEPGPSLQLLEWFMVEFSDSAGYLGFGCSSDQELPPRAMRWVRSSIAGMGWHLHSKYPHGTEGFFANLVSLEGARAIIAAFHGTEFIQSSLYAYIFDAHARDLRSNRYEYFAGLLETYLLKTVTRADDKWFLRGNKFLVGHALLYLFNEHWLRYDGPSRNAVMICISFVHEHDNTAFCQQNDACSTALDVVLTRPGIFPVIIEGRLGKDKAPMFHYFLVKELVKTCPSSCLMRNGAGQLPIHVVFDHVYHPLRNQLISLLLEAAPEVVERRCLSTGLYPFQIAAVNGAPFSGCSCSSCYTVGVSLSNIYTLLRLCPALVATAIPFVSKTCTKLEIARAIASLAVSRKRREVIRLKRELEIAECALSLCEVHLKMFDEMGDDHGGGEEREFSGDGYDPDLCTENERRLASNSGVLRTY